MADRSVSVLLKANVTGYLASIEKAKLSTKDFARDTAKSATQHKQSWDNVGKGMLITGGLIAAGVGAAVKASMDFQAQMAQVKSLSGATADEMKLLGDAAKTTGQKFGISATEAADAETELVKAGISVKDILGGGLQGALTLAADGQMNVADATSIAASAMVQFGMSGKDVPHIADLLAAGADKALGSVGDLGQALTSSGTVAAQWGLTMEQTVGTLAEFAAAGQTGERGGTLLRQMLLQLTTASGPAKKLMDQYGFSVETAGGGLADTSEIAGRLQKSFGGLDVATRTHALGVIFGAHAIQGANILMKDGAQVNADWAAKVNDSGFAAKQAAGKMDSLAGDVTKLKAAFQNALIDTGDEAQASLRGITGRLTGLVEAYNDMSPANKKMVVDLGLITAAVGLAGGGFLILVPRIVATKAAMMALAESSPKVVAGLAAVGKAASLVGVALAAQDAAGYINQSNQMVVANQDLVDSLTQFGDTGKAGKAVMHLFGSKLGGDMNDTTAALKAFSAEAYNAFSTGWEAKVRRATDFGQTLNTLKGNTDQLDAAFAQMVQSGNQEGALNALTKFTDAGQKEGISLQQLMTLFPKYSAAVLASKGKHDDLTDSVTHFTKAETDAADAAKTLSADLEAMNKPVLDLRSAQRDYAQSVADATAAVKKNGDTHYLATQKGRDNGAALDAMAKSAQTLAEKVLDETGSEAKFRSSLATSRGQLVKTAEKMGYTKDQALLLANQILAIPASRKTAVGLTGFAKAIYDAKALGQILRANSLLAAQGYAKGTTYRTPNGYTGGLFTGDRFQHFSDGGPVWGGPPGRDTVNAKLDNGEYVINAKSTAAIGVDNLHALNRYASGGMAGFAPQPMTSPTGMPSTMILQVGDQQFTAYVRQQAGGVAAVALSRAGDRVRAVPR